jgi:hypothetical protein
VGAVAGTTVSVPADPASDASDAIAALIIASDAVPDETLPSVVVPATFSMFSIAITVSASGCLAHRVEVKV